MCLSDNTIHMYTHSTAILDGLMNRPFKIMGGAYDIQ